MFAGDYVVLKHKTCLARMGACLLRPGKNTCVQGNPTLPRLFFMFSGGKYLYAF